MSDETNHISLGDGRFVIGHGYFNGERAVFIEPVPESGIVGTPSKAGLARNAVVAGATVITLTNLRSACVLHAALAEAALLEDKKGMACQPHMTPTQSMPGTVEEVS